MSDKNKDWGVTSFDSGFKLIHIESENQEDADLLEGFISDDDANLIAAAPDLLEALQMCLNIWSDDGILRPQEKDSIKAAIAKAKGEQE